MNDNTAVSGGTGYKPPTLNRAVVSDFQIYEVKDHELETLREGRDGGIYLNIAVSFFSIAISLLVSILYSKPQSDVTQAYLNCAIIGTLLIGCVFLFFYAEKQNQG